MRSYGLRAGQDGVPKRRSWRRQPELTVTRSQFLVMDILDTSSAAAAFEQEFHIPYPSVSDPAGRIPDGFGFIGQPDTIFFGANGSRTATLSGPLDQHVLSTNINRLLRVPSSPDAAENG